LNLFHLVSRPTSWNCCWWC